jgi:ABC-type lipoprotein release transport system permease subunit
LSGLEGVGEIAAVLEKPSQLDITLQQIQPRLTSGNVLLSWKEIRPDSLIAVEINEGMSEILTFILIFVAFVGVASAQLTAIFERQKEFAVLSAIGVGGWRLIGFIFSEAIILGIVSWIVTLFLSGPLLYHYGKVGIRLLSKNQSMSAMGTVIDPIFHLDFGNWFFVYAGFLCCCSTLAASIYPAIFTWRLNPAEALRVAQ